MSDKIRIGLAFVVFATAAATMAHAVGNRDYVLLVVTGVAGAGVIAWLLLGGRPKRPSPAVGLT